MTSAQNRPLPSNGSRSMKRLTNILTLAGIFLCLAFSTSQNNYLSHQVQAGETVYSIAKRYGITTEAIYKLNPDATKGISSNSTLIIPFSEGIVQEREQVGFKKHRVKRKETLYGIAQKYKVSEDEIKRYNKHLYSKQLKKGEKLQIPIFKEPLAIVIDEGNSNSATSNLAKHTVLPKETRYGIARKYGITLAELQELNPDVDEILPIGAVLNVPDSSVLTESVIEDELFDFYEVQPKEGFFRLKVKLGLTEEEIVALNPYAAEGLKSGMILKIPKESTEALSNYVEKVNLEFRITNTDPKNLAVMLPFQLSKFNVDSLKQREDVLKAKRNNAIRVALDFYSGVLMAAEFAKDKGISVNLSVYDTEASTSKVDGILSSNDFNDTDAIIGPLLQKNVERTALALRSSGTPVFSPLSNRNIKITSNLFQTLPPEGMLEKAMIDYLKANSEGKNVVLISDSMRQVQKNAIMAAIPDVKAISPREEGFLYQTDLEERLNKEGTENWVILESSDPVIVSNVVGLLNGMPEEYIVRLFTLEKGDVYDFDDISNRHLAKLNFTFPSISKSYDYTEKDPFLVSYKNKYGVLPNRFAVRGFDLTYDVILRLASAHDIYDASKGDFETEYIENKFRYSKKFLSGYQNNAFYIIKYNQQLQFEVVE